MQKLASFESIGRCRGRNSYANKQHAARVTPPSARKAPAKPLRPFGSEAVILLMQA